MTVKETNNIIDAVNYISGKQIINFAVFGGDNMQEIAPDLGAHLLKVKNLGQLLKGMNIPYVVIKGNHDDNSIEAYIQTGYYACGYEMHDDQFYNYLCKQNENSKTVTLDSARGRLCSYIDLDTSKIRFIFLNCIDIPYINVNGKLKYDGQHIYGYSGEQLSWLANKALNFSTKEKLSEWSVVLIQHVPFAGGMTDDYLGYNSDILDNIVHAYRNGLSYNASYAAGDFPYNISVDFKSQGAMNVIATLCGHVHRDYDVFANGILNISTMQAGTNGTGNGVSRNGTTYIKIPGTADETAFDIFTIDTDKKIIYTTRYGVGADRIFHYEAVSMKISVKKSLTTSLRGNITWASDNMQIAYVNNGTVSASAKGVARITATDTNGNYEVFYVSVS